MNNDILVIKFLNSLNFECVGVGKECEMEIVFNRIKGPFTILKTSLSYVKCILFLFVIRDFKLRNK